VSPHQALIYFRLIDPRGGEEHEHDAFAMLDESQIGKKMDALSRFDGAEGPNTVRVSDTEERCFVVVKGRARSVSFDSIQGDDDISDLPYSAFDNDADLTPFRHYDRSGEQSEEAEPLRQEARSELRSEASEDEAGAARRFSALTSSLLGSFNSCSDADDLSAVPLSESRFEEDLAELDPGGVRM